MIHSLDTYVYTQIETKLDAILKSPLILEEALKSIDRESRERFINTFAGEKPKQPIEIGYTYPPSSETFSARFVIEMGRSTETSGAIGGVVGTFEYKQEGMIRHKGVVETRGDRLAIDLPSPIGEVDNIEEFTFSESDNVVIDGQTILFNRYGNERFIGMEVTVHYNSKEVGNDAVGIHKGYTVTEEVHITPLSINRDTARCLDLILKVILITMRETSQEKEMYALQSAKHAGMQILISDADMYVHGRPLTLTYNVTHSIRYEFRRQLEEIFIKGVDH